MPFINKDGWQDAKDALTWNTLQVTLYQYIIDREQTPGDHATLQQADYLPQVRMCSLATYYQIIHFRKVSGGEDKTFMSCSRRRVHKDKPI